MKITTTSKDLKQGLSITSGIAKTGILPILSNILLSKSGPTLTFKATDNEVEVKTTVTTGDGDDFSVTVPAAKFSKIVDALPDDAKVTIDIDGDKMTIKSGRSKLGLQTMPAADFPTMGADTLAGEIDIGQQQLKTMLQSVAHAMDTKLTKPFLCGAFFDVKDGVFNVVATDGFRLANNSTKTDSEDVSEIVPRNTIIKLIKLLGDGVVKIQFFNGKVRFLIGDTEITSKLHEGKYPDYSRVIPKNNDISIEFEKNKILECVGVATIVLGKNRVSRIAVSDAFTMTCTAAGETSSDGFEIDYKGEALDIGFNPDFIKEATSAFESEKITIKFNSKGGPILMTGDGNLQVVVMNLKV